MGLEPTVLVVDGQSTDDTRQVATDWGAEVIVQAGRGKGAATREGIAWARDHGAESVVVIDADYTYPGPAIAPILSLLDAGSDLVIGVRRRAFNPIVRPRDLLHKIGNSCMNYLGTLLSGSPLLDVCSGLWGIRTSVVDALGLQSTGFDIESEVFLKSWRYGLRITQIPIQYRTRVGVAKLHALRDGTRGILAIVRYARSHPPSGWAAARAAAPQRGELANHDLQAICLALDAKELLISSHHHRFREALELAWALRGGLKDVRVDFPTVRRSAQSPTDPEGLEAPPTALPEPPITITLPQARSAGADSMAAVVDLPNTQRLIYLSPLSGLRTTEGPLYRSGGYRLESADRVRPSRLRLLGAAFAPSWGNSELALLTANAASRQMQVYRRRE